MKLPAVFFLFVSLFFVLPAKAEITEIENASWQEVPGTFSPNAREEYASPAYVDVNGIIRNGDRLTYDIIGSDAGYARTEANCRTGEFRTLRWGYFESNRQVNYENLISPWMQAESSYHRALLEFVCSQN
jgi:hypothetical protein